MFQKYRLVCPQCNVVSLHTKDSQGLGVGGKVPSFGCKITCLHVFYRIMGILMFLLVLKRFMN